MTYHHGKARGEQAMADIMAELERWPMTCSDLMAQLLLSECRISIYLGRLKKQQRIHIAGWRQESLTGHQSRVFALGDKRDTPRPQAQPKSVRDRLRKLQRKAEAAEAAVAPVKPAGPLPAAADPYLAWIPRRAA